MRKLSLCSALLALFVLHAPLAQAATFTWSYSDGVSNTGSGSMDAIDLGGGRFSVDAIAGTANGQTITGLTSYAGQNQTIYTTNPHLDSFGVAFTVTGDQAYNFYYWVSAGSGVNGYDCGVTGYCLMGPGIPGTSGLGGGDIPQDVTAPVNFELTETSAVPLPDALPMFAMSLGTLALLYAWRKPKNA